MLVSATHQHESAAGIRMFPPSWTSLPPPSPSPPHPHVTGRQTPVPCSQCTLASYSAYGGAYVQSCSSACLLWRSVSVFWPFFDGAVCFPEAELYELFTALLFLSRAWLCNPMGCSTPDSPVLHCLLEFTQTHVHWVSDAIQPSHPLLSPSPPALNLSQHQGLCQ